MKLTWKNKNTSNGNNNNKKRSLAAISHFPNLPFEHQEDQDHDQDQANSNNEDGDKELALGAPQTPASLEPSDSSDAKQLAESFQAQGNKLAEHGKYREALGKWEAALMLMPEIAVIHEQKAQVLLEIGDSWKALKAATRATELEPSWAEAWITLGRAQLNFGEPDSAIESFDRALAIKPDSKEAQDDKRTASHLIKRRKQLHSEGLNASENRYMVGDSLNATENRYMVGDETESSQGILIRKE